MKTLALCASLLIVGCADLAEDATTEAAFAAPVANPPSPALPAAWNTVVRARSIVAVAGTNSARETTEKLARGEGTQARPLDRVQAFEAAATLIDVARSTSRVVYAFGYGAAPVKGKRYVYRALSSEEIAIVFLGEASVSPGESPGPTSFGTEQARADAEALKRELHAATLGDVVLVGHSWGGAVVDYGKQLGILTAPAISLGAPSKLYSNPFQSTRLRDEGNVRGDIYVARRPDDPIGDENILVAILALIDRERLAAHDYMMASGGTWGLSGPGTLCSARYGGGCPAP